MEAVFEVFTSAEDVLYMTTDTIGNIYFTTINYLWKYDNNTSSITRLASRPHNNGLVWRKPNSLYMICTSNHRIKEYNLDSKKWNHSFAGCGLSGHKDGSFKEAEFDNPSRIECDDNGDLIVVDGLRIRKLCFQSQQVETVPPTGAPYLLCCHENSAKRNILVREAIDGKSVDTHPALQYTTYSSRQTFLERDGNVLIIGLQGIFRLHHKTQNIDLLVEGFPSEDARRRTVTKDHTGRILFSIGRKVYQVGQYSWSTERLLWIGFLKNEPEECLLANLPAELVNKIAELLRASPFVCKRSTYQLVKQEFSEPKGRVDSVP